MLQRRTVRVKAMQNMYAYYILKKSTQELLTKQLDECFKRDVFHENKGKEKLLDEDRIKLRGIWENYLKTGEEFQMLFSTPTCFHDESRAKNAFSKTKTAYLQGLKNAESELKASLQKEKNHLSYILAILVQLLVEWFKLAKRKSSIDKPYELNLKESCFEDRVLAKNQFSDKLADWITYNKKGKPAIDYWMEHQDVIQETYHNLIDFEKFRAILSGRNNSLNKDLEVVNYLMGEVIFKNKPLQSLLKELDIQWDLNKPILKRELQELIKNINNQPSQGSSFRYETTWKGWSEGILFYEQLVEECLQSENSLSIAINDALKNWDISRVALLDLIALKLALCELWFFPLIPKKVTLDEYIEIVKKYSTPKSGQFINGILDPIDKLKLKKD